VAGGVKRREKRGQEAGEKEKPLCSILQLKKCKEA